MNIRIACFVLFALATAASVAAESADQQKRMEEARERVWAFERTLLDHTHPREGEGKPLTEEHRESIREFFAGLDSSEMKIAALGMMYQRFVYVIPEDMEMSLIEPLLDDADPDVQASALGALGYNSPGKAVKKEKVLVKAQSEHPAVRKAAAWAMGRSGQAVYATPLINLIDDPDADVRAMAISSWEDWRRMLLRTTLIPKTSDPDRDVAARALTSLYNNLSPPDPDKDPQTHPVQANRNLINMINHHYRTLSPNQQAEFRLALKRAKKVPAWFRDEVTR